MLLTCCGPPSSPGGLSGLSGPSSKQTARLWWPLLQGTTGAEPGSAGCALVLSEAAHSGQSPPGATRTYSLMLRPCHTISLTAPRAQVGTVQIGRAQGASNGAVMRPLPGQRGKLAWCEVSRWVPTCDPCPSRQQRRLDPGEHRGLQVGAVTLVAEALLQDSSVTAIPGVRLAPVCLWRPSNCRDDSISEAPLLGGPGACS